jgi:hypothetical protein
MCCRLQRGLRRSCRPICSGISLLSRGQRSIVDWASASTRVLG